MKICEALQIQLHAFLASALDWGQWSASHLGHFNFRVRGPGTHEVSGWVLPRAELDAVEKRKICCCF